MKIFVTGATGWVGSAVAPELIGAGHRVTALARSKDKAAGVAEAGATVVDGTLDDLELLRECAQAADGVIHLAFNHDFSRFAENVAQDRRAIDALGDALVGTDRPLIVTSGLGGLAPGRVATETDMPDGSFPRQSDAAARDWRRRGLRATAIRLAPSVHGIGDHGFVPILVRLARETGVSAFVGDGMNRWPGVHRLDAARLYRLVVEAGASEPAYHAVADEGVPFKDIAAAIGRGLGVPVASRDREHFGWFGAFAAMDMPASSARSRSLLGWQPTGPGLLADLGEPSYYVVD